MKIRLGTLRRILNEEIVQLGEEAWVPGRWYPSEGEPLDPDEANRIGEPCGMDEMDEMDETDARMLGDDKGPTNRLGDDDSQISDHLRDDDDEKRSLGNAPDETMEEVRSSTRLRQELTSILLKENPPGAGMVDPTDIRGAYTPFDMANDHMGTDDLSSMWYRSPGREPGSDGDPFRGPDPHSQLGFHAPENDPANSPPGAQNRGQSEEDEEREGENGDANGVVSGDGKAEKKEKGGGAEAEGEKQD